MEIKTGKTVILGGALCIFLIMSWCVAIKSEYCRIENGIKKELLKQSEIAGLLADKEKIEAEWLKKKQLFEIGQSSEQALNIWVKRLLDYSQSQGIAFDKIEPLGARNVNGATQISVYVSFEGDALKLTRFLYHIKENDPFAVVESVGIKQPEETRTLSCEITLAKNLPQ